MEVDSDSSSGSVTITGPIPEYPELRRKLFRTQVPARNVQPNRRKELIMDINADNKVEKIQELEDLVKSTQSRSVNHKDVDVDAWSESDSKSNKGSGKRDPASKYLKKIKTLQQNKRRQETRISRLTKEVRSLRDKVSVQAAYIDVLCGMLGDDMKSKFRDRQGTGILGNTKVENEHLEGVTAVEGVEKGSWSYEDAANDKTSGSDRAQKGKETEFYCVEDLDEEVNDMSRAGSSEDLKGITEMKDETSGGEVAAMPLDGAGPSTSFGAIGTKITGMESNGLNALTIAVPISDGSQMGGAVNETHHEVFGAPYKRLIRNYAGQVGESVFSQVPRVTGKEIGPYGEMRVQVVQVEPQMEPIPSMISYGMVMENRGLNILPSVLPTADDPLNIGFGDGSPIRPLIISTSRDPLNLIPNASASNRMELSRASISRDPLNIGADEALIGEDDLPNGDNNQSSALHISIPRFTADSHMDADPAPQPVATDSDMSSQSTTRKDQDFSTHPTNLSNFPHLSHSLEALGGLSMPSLSDNDDFENISQPQAIVDHLINNISCDFSPNLRLD